MAELGTWAGVGSGTRFEEPTSEPFTGIILADEITPSEYSQDGTQWHLAIRPLEYALNGDTGCYHDKANNSITAGSKLDLYIQGLLKSVQPDFKDAVSQIGQGKLVGAVCRFQRQTHKFGKFEVRMTVPVGKADADQVAAAKNLSPLTTNPSWNAGSGSGAVSAAVAKVLTAEDLAKVLTVVDGKNAVERMMVAAQLGGDLGASVADGSAVKQLVDGGFATLTEAGVVQASVQA